MALRASWVLLCLPALLFSQSDSNYKDILTRLERLEQQNRELRTEIGALRDQLAERQQGPAPAVVEKLEERVAVAEQRNEEHEQSKLGSDHKLPVTLTGMLLFNAYTNGHASADTQYPTTAAATPGPVAIGASFRQTTIGLKMSGPEVWGGGKVSGTLFMDFFGGPGVTLNQLVRLRIATLNVDWKNTSLEVGVDKPIVAPREPESLAQVGVSPLTGAGNLWLWQPQARIEQRFAIGENAGLRAQLGIYQTSEFGTGVTLDSRIDRARPGYEGRFELWRQWGASRIEMAPGFHVSDSHLRGVSVPSRIFTLDWLVRPVQKLDFSGAFFDGENIGVLGGLRQGITIFPNGEARAIQAYGGWGQVAYRPTARLSFHAYGGQESDRGSDLLAGAIARNRVLAANVMYRLGSNVIAGFEASKTRTSYFQSVTRTNPHYDLSIAYLF